MESDSDDDFNTSGGMRDHMRGMDRMMSSMFDGIGMPHHQLGITDGRSHARNDRQVATRHRNDAFAPFGTSIFSQFDSVFDNMRTQLQRSGQDGNSHSYSHSSVMTYDSSSGGQPKYYEATTSERRAPGGVREVRRTVRDSTKGLEKMAIGHHIQDRGHVREKAKYHFTGDMESNEEFINMDEAEAEEFDREFQRRTGASPHSSYHPYGGSRPALHHSSPQRHATSSPHRVPTERYRRRSPPRLALPARPHSETRRAPAAADDLAGSSSSSSSTRSEKKKGRSRKATVHH